MADSFARDAFVFSLVLDRAHIETSAGYSRKPDRFVGHAVKPVALSVWVNLPVMDRTNMVRARTFLHPDLSNWVNELSRSLELTNSRANLRDAPLPLVATVLRSSIDKLDRSLAMAICCFVSIRPNKADVVGVVVVVVAVVVAVVIRIPKNTIQKVRAKIARYPGSYGLFLTM